MTSKRYILVFDDVRELPYTAVEGPTLHATNVDEFIDLLNIIAEEYAVSKAPISDVVLDHDLGGEAFGEETSRVGIRRMCDMYEQGRIDVIRAIIVTMNPAGRQWIAAELDRVGIPHVSDPGGRQIGMTAPKGWQ